MSTVDLSSLCSVLSRSIKKRNILNALERESIAKIRSYGTKTREQNRKKVICVKKMQHKNYPMQNENKRLRNQKNIRVLRATAMNKQNKHNKNSKQNKVSKKKNNNKKLRKKMINLLETKENCNNFKNKKYKYRNEPHDALLSWMKKQKKNRSQKQRKIQKSKASEIQKRKNYILNLNKNQRNRAQKIMQRKKMQKINSNSILISETISETISQTISPLKSTKLLTDNKGNPNQSLLLTVYNCIQQNQLKRNKKHHIAKNENNFETIETIETIKTEMEHRLNILKDTNCKLQKRLENIACTNNKTCNKLLFELELLQNIENIVLKLDKLYELEMFEENNNNNNNNLKEKCELISLNLISNIVSKLFNETQSLLLLRNNKASILCGQYKIEKSTIEKENLYIELYINNIFKYCNELELHWSLNNKTIFNQNKKQNKQQKGFNNLIFDTLNEVLIESKLTNKNCKIKPTQKHIIKTVQQKINKINICETEKKLKQHFTYKQIIDNRIRLISNQWIKEFENSYEWMATFDTFKNSMKFQIADMIFEQIITDIVCELNQIKNKTQI